MDTGKTRGNYASAYKLSRSTTNNKALRRERRSIEQKELRLEEINKRRNLCDLSPLQEGDSTLSHDKSYKDKTPKKPKTDEQTKKGLDRLEQLKKWKQDRERKRKEDEVETRKRNPVFRVSKAVAHTDTRLFKAGSKIHPVKPKPAPVGKPASKAVATHVKPITQTKPNSGSVLASRSQTQTRSRHTEKSNTSGKERGVSTTRSSSRGATKAEPVLKDKPTKKEKAPVQKPMASSTRTLRSSRQAAVNPELTSKTISHTAKDKASGSKFKSVTVPKPVFEPQERETISPGLDLSRVTRRADTSELPADSFAQTSDFGFSAASFVFRPLSPASAAGFLCPSQDTSCSSFLETNPNRSSTPKKGEKRGRQTSADVTAVNKTVLNQTDVSIAQDVTQVNTTVTEQNDKTLVASPDVKDRSVRRSRRSVRPVENDTDVDKDDSKVPAVSVIEDSADKPTPRRNPRRSVSSNVIVENSENAEQSNISKSTPKRSLRHSAVMNNSESEDNKKSDEEVKTPRRLSRRKSAIVSSDSDSKESSEAETVSPVKKRRSLRRSVLSGDSDSEVTVDRKTPRSARKSRRSVAIVKEQETIQEVAEEVDSSDMNDEVFEEKEKSFNQEDDKENAGPTTEARPAEKRKLSDRTVTLALPKEKVTPTNKKKRSRNKSFGGFRLPDADSVVLSAKRKPRRKTLMPKSPEEWVEVLSNSPMVEMTRRKHKPANTSLPILNFDDIDFDEPESSLTTDEADVKASGSESAVVVEDRNEVSPVAMETEENKENEPEAVAKTNEEAVVQVGEVSSTQDGPLTDESSSDSEQDVQYFRNLLRTQTARLSGLNDEWNTVNDNTDLTEEVHGQIRTTVGQSMLLMNQRFKQFSGLVDDCEFKLGEKETTCMDLKGFWEMIYYQVEDVDKKFEELKKLKDNNWVDDKPKLVAKKIKKKVSKPVVSKPAVKSKFAAFRAQMKKQKVSGSSPAVVEKEEEKVFEVPGFFSVSSPVRTPKPHCEGGTPKKGTPSSAKSEQTESSNDNQALSGSGDILMNRTPARKSYIPAVPSPLLQDTTPLPRPMRLCTQQRLSVPKRIIDEVDQSEKDVSESESKRAKKTPARRSLRPRKSVNFSDEVSVSIVSSPTVEDTEGSDADFARLLQPMETIEDKEDNKAEDVMNDSFSKYLQPLSTLDTSLEKDDTPKQRRGRRSSLKGCRSTERRRSRQHSVHFVSPSLNNSQHIQLPHTPYNKNSLVKQKRVTRRSHQPEEDVYSIDNIDNDENVPPPTFRSPRPSLLGTPPDLKRASTRTAAYVPTGTLIEFTP